MKTTRKTAASAPKLSLEQRLLAIESARHAGRLEAIKRMRARLALLQAFIPAIDAAGIWLEMGALSDWGGKSLWISTGVLDHSAAARLVNVLVASGMSVHERKDYGGAGGSTLHLKKGRLLVTVSVDHRAVHLLEVPACA